MTLQQLIYTMATEGGCIVSTAINSALADVNWHDKPCATV